MKRALSLIVKTCSKRAMAFALTLLILLSLVVIPQGITAAATSLSVREFNFDKNSGTVYGVGATVKDSKGVTRNVSGVGFTNSLIQDNGVLSLTDTREARNGRETFFILNDNNGICELNAGASYTVSLKFKVVSNQVSFVYNNITYPEANQFTNVKLVYGSNNKTEIGHIAKLKTDVDTFTQDNKTLPIGEWHELTFDFTAPNSFLDGENFVSIVAETFNGADIQFDDIAIKEKAFITVDAKGGTISKTQFAHAVGDKVNIENPKYEFGWDFDGWYYDEDYTIPFTDEYITEENKDAKLYAKWSDNRFGFEGYTPSHPKEGFSHYFYEIIEADDAPQGKNVLYYHYTEEYWSQIRSGSEEEGNAVYYYQRRASGENNFTLKKVSSNTEYVITFKYKVPKGSGDVVVFPATSYESIWTNLVEYKDYTLVLNDDNPDVWQEARMVFKTGSCTSPYNHLSLRMYAADHTHTEIYIDDVKVQDPDGEAEVELIANGGKFKDSTTAKIQKINIGDSLSLLNVPAKENYDFGGWSFDANGTNLVETDVVDNTVYSNTLYAVWTNDMGFESYYYDLDSSDRTNYLSEQVEISKSNAYQGSYSAKLTNTSSNKQHVIALNPISNKTRYLVSFRYKVENATAPINVSFATINMNINNSAEVKRYSEIYTIAANEAGEGYNAGALIIETDFAVSNANRLALLAGSDNSSTYTVYFDSVSVTQLLDDEGYIIFSNPTSNKSEVKIGKLGQQVELDAITGKGEKFFGWYSDKDLTNVYDGNAVYSEDLNRIYIKTIKGQDFENYTPSGSYKYIVKDPYDSSNKALSVTGSTSFEIGKTQSGKKYAVEFDYNLVSAADNVTVYAGSTLKTLTTADAAKGWKFETLVVTANSSELEFGVSTTSGVQILIDNVFVYEIDESVSVIHFDQAEGYGEDIVRIGAKGTPIVMPGVPTVTGKVFYGWYKDQNYSTYFADSNYPSDDEITLYARWADNPITKVSFDDADQATYMTETNSNRTSIVSGRLEFDKQSETDESGIYAPLFNKDGYVKLEGNKTYAISFLSYYEAYTSSATMTLEFYVASGTSFEGATPLGGDVTVGHAYSSRAAYTYITTPTLISSNDVLYIKVKDGDKKTTLYLDNFVITRVDSGRNHAFLYDDRNTKLYEVDGSYGQKIDYPNIDTSKYVVEGWYNSVELDEKHESNLHKNEAVSVLFCRWELPTITFENKNYYYEDAISRYSFGDDMSLSTEERYDNSRSLKYSYKYAHNYFETSNNTAGIGRVNDNSTYKITFMYKVTEAQSDVDIKFLTANLHNRWAFITNYNEATYRIYSSEIGNGWKEATVYLTTKFQSSGASALFMTFNPVVEGDTVVYIDTIKLEYLQQKAVIAYVGKEGRTDYYETANAGETVSDSNLIPTAKFASFDGWYTDKDCTKPFTSKTAEAGMNYIYSRWTDKKENFTNYYYASGDNSNYSQNNQISDGVLTYTAQNENKGAENGFRIGKLSDNTTYKITFRYKTSSDLTVKFATADELNIGVNTTVYNDEGNFLNATGDNIWHTATVYISTAFTYTVPKDNNINAINNKNANFGDMLYMFFEHSGNAQISIDDISVEQIEVLSSLGTSVLTKEAEEEAGSQALRFYFSYPTKNLITVTIDGKEFTLVERGIVFKNARNTATGIINGDEVTVKPIILQNQNDKGYTAISKTSGFNKYWSYDSKTESVVFSGYVKNFTLKDARLMGAKGYIKVKGEDDKVYTFYSADKKATVKEGVDTLNEITSAKTHTFGSVQWSNFTIVNPKTMPYIYGRQIEALMDYAKETHGVEFVRVTEKAKETQYEIVIGDTTRDASNIAVENEDQYVIALRGTKLIIKGGSDLATMQGVKDFIDYLKKKDSLGCGADLADGYTKYGTVSKTGDDYKLAFADEFDGATLNRNVWDAYDTESDGTYSSSPSQLGGKIHMKPPYSSYITASGKVVDNAVFLRDGNAVVTTARLNDTDVTMTRMSTFRNMVYQYGIIEFRVKAAATPVHLSLWMNGQSGEEFLKYFDREYRQSMTEYDLLENVGKVNNCETTIHHWWSATSVRDSGHGVAGHQKYTYTPYNDEIDIFDDYHIYTFLWENDGITFAFDGVKYFDFPVDDTYLERVANYIIIGAGMANRDYGSKYDINIHKDYYETLVDYVRIYQVENMGSRIVWSNK